MKSSFDSNCAATGPLASVERERDREREAPDTVWIATLAQTVVERVPRLAVPGAGEPGAPSAQSATAPSAEPRAGGASSASGTAGLTAHDDAGPSGGVPAELTAEMSDERFGRLHLHIARGRSGLDIVINVADSRVKALIVAEQALLIKSLKDAGLRVGSVQISDPPRAGTALATDRSGQEKARASAGFSVGARRRTYATPRPEEDEPDSDGFDFTA